MTDVFVALAEALPKPGDIFPTEDRIRWLRAFAAVANYVFHTDYQFRMVSEPDVVEVADVVPAPVFTRADPSAPLPPLANLHMRTGMVEVDWAEAERLLKDGTEAQRLQSMLLIGLRDDKFFTMGQTPPVAAPPTKPPQTPTEAPVFAENPQDPAPDPIETTIEGATKRVRLREMWARQIPIDQIARTLGWERATVYGTARKIGLPTRKGGVGNCGCGRPATHNGRCAFRRGLSGPGSDVRARTSELPTCADPQTEPDACPAEVAPVVQPVERAAHNGQVAGSSPAGRTSFRSRDNGFRPLPPPAPPSPTPERRSADQDQIDAAIAAGKMRRIPSPGEPGFSGIGELIRDPDSKKERRVATPNIDQITEILQYLRNEGDTVVGSSRDTYTINGAAMKINEVLARANLMRARAKKEPFRLEA